jgi:nucleoside-triphosphatase THEP1
MSGALIGLLTGAVGSGKTTAAQRVAGLARRRGLVCGGLLAPALTDQRGSKIGIWGVDLLTGERRTLARTDRELGGPILGVYSFDDAVLTWAASAIEGAISACDLLIVDEIGRLELWSHTGLAPIVPRLASGEVTRSLVLVRASLLAELQARLGRVEQVMFEVSAEDRDELPLYILARLFGAGEFDNSG